MRNKSILVRTVSAMLMLFMGLCGSNIIGFGSEVGAILGFQPASNDSTSTTILVRTGVSFISTDKACANAEADIPGPVWDFDGLASAARAQWNDLLGRVNVTLSDDDDQEDMRELLYSSLYRTHIVPADCKLFSRHCSTRANEAT